MPSKTKKAFKEDIIIDDTPEAVILSGFNPVRREVARLSLEQLIADGRIHPARIEEIVEKVSKELEVTMREAGEQVTFDVGVHGLHVDLIKLLGRLVKDPRVPRRSKVVIGAALAYLVSPVDLIPEFVPVVGFADDILLVSYAVNHLITVAGEDVVLEHWDGPRDMLELVRSVLEVASDLVPPQLKRLIGRLSGA